MTQESAAPPTKAHMKTTRNELISIFSEAFKFEADVSESSIQAALKRHGIFGQTTHSGSLVYHAFRDMGFGLKGNTYSRKSSATSLTAPISSHVSMSLLDQLRVLGRESRGDAQGRVESKKEEDLPNALVAITPVSNIEHNVSNTDHNVYATLAVSFDFEDGEPRVRDTDLGKFLGMAQPRNIRSLIASYSDTLGRRTERVRLSDNRNGQVLNEEFLTEEQTVFITAKSGTATANAILKKVIGIFIEARKGNVKQAPSMPSFDASALVKAMAESQAAAMAPVLNAFTTSIASMLSQLLPMLVQQPAPAPVLQVVPTPVAAPPATSTTTLLEQLKADREKLKAAAPPAPAPAPPIAIAVAFEDQTQWINTATFNTMKGLNMTAEQRQYLGSESTKAMRAAGRSPLKKPSRQFTTLNYYPLDVLESVWARISQSYNQAAE